MYLLNLDKNWKNVILGKLWTCALLAFSDSYEYFGLKAGLYSEYSVYLLGLLIIIYVIDMLVVNCIIIFNFGGIGHII